MPTWLLLLLFLASRVSPNKIQQVHLSYHGEPSQMVVTWLTMHPLDSNDRPFVKYGTDGANLAETAAATTTAWLDEGADAKERYTHRAVMDGLAPGKMYYYSVGSPSLLSSLYSFYAIDNSRPPRFSIFGDLSILNGHSIDPLINATQRHMFDIVFHIGDLAYNLQDKNGKVGDDFMNAIEPMAAYVPYMVIAGNHEFSDNFNHLRNRFTMPPNGILDDNQFWSITINNTHFFGLSTEYYGFEMSEQAQIQYDWLTQDLEENKADWTVGFMHRPMYCCNDKKKGCQDRENTMTRNGEPGYPALEPLFNQHGVDMVFWGHKHTYERNYPVYESTVYPQKHKSAFHNAQTPVYTLTGAAGCHSHTLPIQNREQPFSAERLGEFGYSYVEVLSSTQVVSHFISTSPFTPSNSTWLDPFSLTKDEGYRPGIKTSLSRL